MYYVDYTDESQTEHGTYDDACRACADSVEDGEEVTPACIWSDDMPGREGEAVTLWSPQTRQELIFNDGEDV